MDGAMGTELHRAGMAPGNCYELWNLTHPERVKAIHQAYVGAGAEVLVTNTFQANPEALANHRLSQQLRLMCEAGVKLACDTAAGAYVLGDMTPFRPGCEPQASLAMVGPWKNADAILIETCADLAATFALVAELRKSMLQLQQAAFPLLLSFTYLRNDKGELLTFDGALPEVAAEGAAKIGAAAVGVNCGRDISVLDCAEIIRRFRAITALPLFARPNAGTPTAVGASWVYPHSPEQMASQLPALLAAGVTMVGGCCGTTAAHIAAFRPVVERWNAQRGVTSSP
jgi:5-methyltetrahydrofolate--homocysteine methyltransferase